MSEKFTREFVNTDSYVTQQGKGEEMGIFQIEWVAIPVPHLFLTYELWIGIGVTLLAKWMLTRKRRR